METSQRPQMSLGWEEIASQVTVYVRKRKSYLTLSSGLSHIGKEEESHSDIWKRLWGITIDIPDLVNIMENKKLWKIPVDSHLDRSRRKYFFESVRWAFTSTSPLDKVTKPWEDNYSMIHEEKKDLKIKQKIFLKKKSKKEGYVKSAITFHAI